MIASTYFNDSRNNECGVTAPAPLRCAISRRVRFEEVDALNIVWHGHAFLKRGGETQFLNFR
jgi:hypothetical protein